ncbi:MAG: alpha/beta hydrolase [Alphaproteobacteria bacterium]|nr:alpha/beta hydrolase [Alphaproteobacteria bacterium]
MLINGQGPRKLRAPMTDLVLLPGFMCDADLWTDMLPDLARIGRVHYGNVYQDDTLEGMAKRVLEQSPEKFILTGFSMGGFVARVLTLAAPKRVIGVAFVASSARGYSAEERARRQAGWQPGNRPPKTNGVAAGLHPDRERDPLLLDRLRGMQRRLGPDVRTRQSALVRNDGYADLERITCPALVVACRQDRLRTFAETERMAQCLPRARFEVIEDCGHMAPLERPRELATLLIDWVEREGLSRLTG